MTIKEYISSGIVESYVLGLADETERTEFERMCATNEEVRAAREAFEILLEQEALQATAAPDNAVKTKLFAELSLDTGRSGIVDINKSKPVNIPDNSTQRARYLAAASVILLVGSTILNFYFFSQYREYSERYSALLSSQTELAKNNQALQTSLDKYQNDLAVIRDPGMSVIKMNGNNVPNNGSPDPSSTVTIYWKKQTSEVYLVLNSLPEAPANQQYQLWAIVNGKPVSAGLITKAGNDVLFKMNNITEAQAFAVTLEKTGGSVAPEGAMYVLGTT
ncbi:MAG: anti-sigma factor [Chitinophagaceae bacterium]|nr:MAG: anti-sigma factor [Chitinophagaceae bacterium]